MDIKSEIESLLKNGKVPPEILSELTEKVSEFLLQKAEDIVKSKLSIKVETDVYVIEEK